MSDMRAVRGCFTEYFMKNVESKFCFYITGEILL